MALQTANRGSRAQGFKFLQEGDTIKGYYQGQVTKPINGTPAVEHTYRTSTGLVSVLGQSDILSQIRDNNITPGTYVEITFTGKMERLKSGRTMKVYNIAFDAERRDANVQEPSVDLEPEDFETSNFDEDETPADVVTHKQPSAPHVVPTATTADRQAKLQAILNKSKSRTA